MRMLRNSSTVGTVFPKKQYSIDFVSVSNPVVSVSDPPTQDFVRRDTIPLPTRPYSMGLLIILSLPILPGRGVG